MNFPSESIQKAVDELSRFPGIGKKSALRMALFLLKSNQDDVEKLSKVLVDLKTKTRFCQECGNICEGDMCNICTSVNRNKDLICVVRDFQDIIAIENTGQYNGVYHVLGGLISPLEGIMPSDLTIDKLLNRIAACDKAEMIMALSANSEGDTTAYYIGKQVEGQGVKVSSVARGIAVGGELEYTDEITLGRSIINRVPFNQS